MVRLGLGLAFAAGLLMTGWQWWRPDVRAHYADNPDMVAILDSLDAADARAALGWLGGSWVQPGPPYYYRPLASYAFCLQHRLFGRSGYGYSAVSWLAHGVVCALLFLLLYRLLPGGRWRLLAAVLAAALTNLRRGPGGPGWVRAPTAMWEVVYWPSQTDILALACVLGGLILLDRHLAHVAPEHERPPRRSLILAVCLAAAGVLFKEQALIAPLPAALLGLLRRGWRESVRLLVVFGLPAAALLLLRQLVLPPGSALPVPSPRAAAERLMLYANERVVTDVQADRWWIIPTALVIAAAFVVVLRTRWSPVWVWLGALVGCLLSVQAFGGNVALLTVYIEASAVVRAAIVACGMAVAVLRPTRLVWTLVACAFSVELPALGVWGPHYFYWPNAFWSLVAATVLYSAIDLAKERLERTRAEAGTKSPPTPSPNEGDGP